MKHHETRSACLAAVSIGALASVMLSGPAMAQQATQAQAEPEVTGLDEIVVTARKVSENQQNVPVAITAFSGADLQRQNATKITDVGRLTPGISFRQSSTNPSGLLVSLRGQFQRDTVATVDPSVGTYVDGVYWARSYGLNADLVDLQSVQILKGPQGTLFGRNTTGGAVVLQTNNPDYDSVSGILSGTYGRFNERVISGVLNLPIVTDRIALRGALQVSQRDGYLHDYITGETFDNRDNITGRLKLGIKAADNLEIILSAEKFRFRQDGQARTMNLLIPGSLADIYINEQGTRGGLTGAGFVYFAQANRNFTATNSGPVQALPPLVDPPQAQYDAETYSGTATLDTRIGEFKVIGAFRGVDGFSKLDLEGSPWLVFTTQVSQDLEQSSLEVQLTGTTFGDRLDYAFGGFGFKEEGFDNGNTNQLNFGQTSASAGVRASAANGIASIATVDNKSSGAYGQVTWHASDRLRFTGGLRYSADTRGVGLGTYNFSGATGAFVSCTLASLGAVRVGDSCSIVSRSDDFTNTSYLASIDYKLFDRVMVYARASSGYRSGGQNARASNPLIFVPFDPEITHDVEVGVKSELFDRRLRLNASAYRSTIDGAQRSQLVQPPGGGLSQTLYGNAAEVEIWGGEAEATAALGEGLTVTASGSITRPKYLSYQDASGDRRGERFNGVPRAQAAFSANYERDLGLARMTLRADYSWADDTPLDEYNTPSNPLNDQIIAASTRPAGGEANVRGNLSFDDGRFEVAVFGRNIFDNRDQTSALQVIGFGFIAAQYREPATWGIQGTYRFGQ